MLVVGILAGGLFIYSVVLLNNIKGQEVLELKIRSGAGWDAVQSQIDNSGQVRFPILVKLCALLLQYDQNVKAGRYVFKPGSSSLDMIRKLRSGNQDPVNLVINNVTFLPQLAAKVSAKLDIDSAAFVTYVQDVSNAEQYGFTRDNFIGMFLCNTYSFFWNTSLEKFVERMHQEYEKYWTEERVIKASNKGLTPEEAIILASIVQKETNYKNEYGTVAGVYLNRIGKGMPLQADPTVKFAVGDMSIRRILNKDLSIDSPYNTYRYQGLPPGPISLPELDVIDGVLNAPQHNYLYFCAVYGSGRHAFASTYQEHLMNARTYQKALNEENIYR